MADERTITEVLTGLAACYPNFQVPKQTVVAYAHVLADIDGEVLHAAALACVAKSRFFPTIAELRDEAYAIATNRLALPSAYEAWEEVMRQVRQVGSYGSPEWSHPWIEAALRQVGGFRYVCQSENSTADRARFIEAYTEAARRHDIEGKTPQMVRDLVKRLESHRQFERLLEPGKPPQLTVRTTTLVPQEADDAD